MSLEAAGRRWIVRSRGIAGTPGRQLALFGVASVASTGILNIPKNEGGS